MARIIDKPADFDGYDVENAVRCPKCGFEPCTILVMPSLRTVDELLREGRGWFDFQSGRARCDFCHIEFGIRAVDGDG